MKKNLQWMNMVLLLCSVFFLSLLTITLSQNKNPRVAGSENGFDQYGYNNTARIFNGTGMSWCTAKGLSASWCTDYLGSSANDKLVMKWTADWDRGNTENWANPPYSKAWTDNEWNGMAKGGSGSVWHYKIKWVGPCTEGAIFSDGGYCIWGQFDVTMDQGTVKHGGHEWVAKAKPSGYGAR